MRRISTPLVLCGCLWLVAGGCAKSDDTGDEGTAGTTGAAGMGTGIAGSTGAAGQPGPGVAGSGSGEAGSGSGVAGTSGVAGSGPAGAPGRGGSTGIAGSAAGNTGIAGSGRGGSTGVAGSGTGVAGSTGAAGSGPGSCTVTVASAATSTMIKTVGIINWTTTATSISSAKIDFGLTTTYGMTAPADDLTAATHKTLLLGMKQAKTYHFKITVSGSGGECSTADQTIMSGSLAAGLMKPTLSPATASVTGLFGGFLITGQYVMGAGAGATAYILDGDGEYVWAFGIGSDVTNARMSYDGKYMWIQNANVPSGTARVHRVTMDGMTDTDLSSKFSGANHQLTVLPDETVAFYSYGSNGCEDIKEYAPSGTVKTVVNAKTARGGTSACHVNNIQYSKTDDALVFSDLDTSTITKVKRSDGSTIWSLGGTSDSATQTYQGTPWKGGEHGIHILGIDKLLMFRNNATTVPGAGGSLGGDASGSSLVEMTLNNSAKTYTMKTIYKASSPKIQNDVMGDVQLLPNGNYVIGYSTKGALHELSSSGTVMQTWTWSAGQTFGYIEKRASLYGPGPR